MFDSLVTQKAPLVDELAAQIALAKRGHGVRHQRAIDSRDVGAGGGFDEVEFVAGEFVGDAGGEAPDDPTWLAGRIAQLLPWRDQSGAPVAMAVVGSGLSERNHSLFPVGTAYVIISVDTWEAAEAVYEALAPVARLDQDGWNIGWARSSHGFREITIFPTSETLIATDAESEAA